METDDRLRCLKQLYRLAPQSAAAVGIRPFGLAVFNTGGRSVSTKPWTYERVSHFLIQERKTDHTRR